MKSKVENDKEKEVENLLPTDLTKLFNWLSKNPEKLAEAIKNDKSLTLQDQQDILRGLHSSALTEKGNVHVSTLPKNNKIAMNDSPTHRRNSSRGHAELKKATQNLNLNLEEIHSKKRTIPVEHQKPCIPRKQGSLEGTESEESSDRSGPLLSDRSGPLLSDRISPKNSPKRSPKSSLSSSISGIGRGFFSSSDSGKNIQVHHNNSGLIHEFKINKPVFKLPVDSKIAKQYIEDIHKDYKGVTIKTTLKDGNLLIMTEGDKQVYLVNCKETIGKGAYAKIHPAFNLKTGELIAAKIFNPGTKYAGFKEKEILVLLDKYYREHFQTSRYHGFYSSDEGCILLKNYEQGINLQDFLHETNPDGEEYNLCFETKVLEYGSNTLYLECIDDYLKYTVIAPSGKLVTDTIKQNEFPYCTFNKDLKIKKLTKFTDKILEITSKREHTFPKYCLNKKDHSPLLLLKIIFLTMQQVDIMHDCGIIHRDLNPKNIIINAVDNQPVITLIDFDSAILLETVSGYKLVMNHKPDVIIEKNTLYVEIIKNRLKYTVLKLDDMPVTDYITDKDLDCSFNESTDIKILRRLLYKIIEITAKRKHTHAGNSKCGAPGETAGYTPPIVNYKASPYDITYDIWQLAIIIGTTITDKHMPDLIREMHFKIYPDQISFPIMASMIDDVFGKRRRILSLNPDKDFADNLQKLVYHNIIFPMLCELAFSMVNTKLKRSTLLAEITNLAELEKECTDYIAEMRGLFSDAMSVHTKLLSIINTIYQDKYSTTIRETFIEPQIYTTMLRDLFGLFKSRLTFSSEDESPGLVLAYK